MSDGLVSVVIPTYNRAALCRRAVESVLAQTYRDLEVIVVDDGSRDETRDVLRAFGPPVRYLRQENAGVSAARNRGLAEARGSFIALLDSDDRFEPWKLEAELRVLRFYPEAGMVWTDIKAVDEYDRELFPAYLQRMFSACRHLDLERRLQEGPALGELWPGSPPALAARRCFQADLGALMFMGSLVATNTVLLRRERQQSAGLFDTSLLKTGEDYDFHYRVCREGPVAYLDVSSVVYRVGASDQLTDPRLEVSMARNTLKTVNAAWKNGEGRIPLPRSMVRDRLAAVHLWVGRIELQEGEPTARRHLLESLRWRPFSRTTLLLLLASLLPRRARDLLRGAKARLARSATVPS